MSLAETLKHYYSLRENPDRLDTDQFLHQLPGRTLLLEMRRRILNRLRILLGRKPL